MSLTGQLKRTSQSPKKLVADVEVVGPSAPPPANTIPLSNLVELVVQSAYHDLIVLSELLPNKSDFERKKAILEWSLRSRNLFVRLLAVVKWTASGSASKISKCMEIDSILRTQREYLIATADDLFRLSKQVVVGAQLPLFDVSAAVDIFNSGSYPRLPACIGEYPELHKPKSHKQLTTAEKEQVIADLNRVILYRMSTSILPAELRNFQIANGRLIFVVPGEFRCSLTLMGDNALMPWRVLAIDCLLFDPFLCDGRSLLHRNQNLFLVNLLQVKLVDCASSSADMNGSFLLLYKILHSFCLSLKLEILYQQALRLSTNVSRHYLLEFYQPKSRLVVGYWRDGPGTAGQTTGPLYRIVIEVAESSNVIDAISVAASQQSLSASASSSGLTLIGKDKRVLKIIHQPVLSILRSQKAKELCHESALVASDDRPVEAKTVTMENVLSKPTPGRRKKTTATTITTTVSSGLQKSRSKLERPVEVPLQRLSLERLIIKTIHVRCFERLSWLYDQLAPGSRLINMASLTEQMEDRPARLSFDLGRPGLAVALRVCFEVSPLTGWFTVRLFPEWLSHRCPIVDDLATIVNELTGKSVTFDEQLESIFLEIQVFAFLCRFDQLLNVISTCLNDFLPVTDTKLNRLYASQLEKVSSSSSSFSSSSSSSENKTNRILGFYLVLCFKEKQKIVY